MRIAYGQISANPAYIGRFGIYCKEAFVDSEGSILGQSRERPIENICRKIETQYYNTFSNKLEQILVSLAGRGIECLVFPEYSIPVQSLYQVYQFSINENCICIAASHTVQASNSSMYERINMDIDIEKFTSMSCCPIFLPNGNTVPVFKKHKSKWESNMGVENEQYALGEDVFYLNYENKKIAIAICIDALKTSVDTQKAKLVITPAASPSTGEFKNKFMSYLSQDIPSIFCNSWEYGGSTLFCHAAKEQNVSFANTTCITEMSKYEEAIVVVDVDVVDHSQKRKSVNIRELVKVKSVLPILYRDNVEQTNLREKISLAAKQKDRELLIALSEILERNCSGVVAEQNSYLYEGICDGTSLFEMIVAQAEYINVNDFSLLQYQANWVEKTLNIINEALVNGEIKVPNALFLIQQRLYSANKYLKSIIKSKADIPVFDDEKKALSSFQNRGSEIRRFRSTYQDTHETIFVLNGFTGIGKSAFIERLKYLYSFQTLERSMPNSAGFESFLRALQELAGISLNWGDFSTEEINFFATELAKALVGKYKTIIVIKSIGRIFDEYNIDKSIQLIEALAKKLYSLKARIKIVIEINRKSPDSLQQMQFVKFCKLEPLSNQYIGRLIEQITTQLTYDISLPQLSSEVISECKGNPNIAKLIGVYLSEKINRCGDSSLTVLEVESFTHSYVDGILVQLNVTDAEKELLSEMCIYRISVSINAFEQLPAYHKEIMTSLVDKMMVEKTDEGYTINSLIRRRLTPQASNLSKLHKIASQYYDEEYKQNNWLTAKAEYFYHLSFFNPALKTKDVRFYSDDILNAAEELSENMQYIDIALSHLKTIEPWKDGYWKYHLILAYCYIMNNEYMCYQQEFEKAVETNQKQPEVSYYLMIKKLIRARKQNETETLLNMAQDKYGINKQLEGLWVSYKYSNSHSKEEAIKDAIRLAKDGKYDLYCAKSIVPILIGEGCIVEAECALNTILNVWSTNSWARSVKYKLSIGAYKSQEDMEMQDDEVD
ncbi:MAG: hypothetical protein RR639_05460 [Hydrogenoanaerobacterium sp.]